MWRGSCISPATREHSPATLLKGLLGPGSASFCGCSELEKGQEDLPSHLRTDPACICKEEENIEDEDDLTSCRLGPVQLSARW